MIQKNIKSLLFLVAVTFSSTASAYFQDQKAEVDDQQFTVNDQPAAFGDWKNVQDAKPVEHQFRIVPQGAAQPVTVSTSGAKNWIQALPFNILVQGLPKMIHAGTSKTTVINIGWADHYDLAFQEFKTNPPFWGSDGCRLDEKSGAKYGGIPKDLVDSCTTSFHDDPPGKTALSVACHNFRMHLVRLETARSNDPHVDNALRKGWFTAADAGSGGFVGQYTLPRLVCAKDANLGDRSGQPGLKAEFANACPKFPKLTQVAERVVVTGKGKHRSSSKILSCEVVKPEPAPASGANWAEKLQSITPEYLPLVPAAAPAAPVLPAMPIPAVVPPVSGNDPKVSDYSKSKGDVTTPSAPANSYVPPTYQGKGGKNGQ